MYPLPLSSPDTARPAAAAPARRTLLRGVGWLLIAQLLGRVARLATTLTVARLLAPEHFGVAAIALATHELAGVIARFATTPAIVRCAEDSLEAHCRAADVLNRRIGIALFVGQCLVAVPIATRYGEAELVGTIATLSLVYLLLPFGAVHFARTFRRQDLRTVAKAEVLQAVVDTVLTVAFAVAGAGVWALVVPKVLVVFPWIAMHRRASPWTSGTASSDVSPRDLLGFGGRVMGVEVLGILRHNLDYLIVGATLGVQALGVYFFAFNAGLGIARGLTAALNGALFPNLCEGDRAPAAVNARFRDGLGLSALVLVPWVTLQIWAAPHYVPLVFGERWVALGAVPVLQLICVAALPIAFVEAGAQYLRARGMPERDLRWHLPFTLAFGVAVAVGAGGGLEAVALAVLGAHLLNLPLYYIFNILPASRERSREPVPSPEKAPAHA